MTQSKYDQVIEAFRQLTEAGETPTQDKIKAIILEKTGIKMSNSTVSKHLQTLRASNPDEFLKVAQSDDEPIPADLMPAVTRAVNHLRRTIELSHSSIQVERLEAEIEQLRDRLADADAVKAELAGLKYAYETQLKRTEELIRENQGLRAGIAPDAQPVLDELNAKLDAIAVERNALSTQVEVLTQQLQDKTADLTILNNQLESLRQDLQEKQNRNQELAIANGQLEPLQEQLAQARATIEALQKQVGSKGQQMTTINGEVFYVDPVIASALAAERQQLIESLNPSQTSIPEDAQPQTEAAPSGIPIEELNLSGRAYNILKRAQINEISDLKKYTQKDLKRIKNLGEKSAEEILDALQFKFGITLPYEAVAVHQ